MPFGRDTVIKSIQSFIETWFASHLTLHPLSVPQAIMEEADLLKERLQAITVRTKKNPGRWFLNSDKPSACLKLSVFPVGEFTIQLHKQVIESRCNDAVP